MKRVLVRLLRCGARLADCAGLVLMWFSRMGRISGPEEMLQQPAAKLPGPTHASGQYTTGASPGSYTSGSRGARGGVNRLGTVFFFAPFACFFLFAFAFFFSGLDPL